MAKAGVLASNNYAYKSQIFERTKDVAGLPNECRFDRGRHASGSGLSITALRKFQKKKQTNRWDRSKIKAIEWSIAKR
jgi:hypothetical protein